MVLDAEDELEEFAWLLLDVCCSDSTTTLRIYLAIKLLTFLELLQDLLNDQIRGWRQIQVVLSLRKLSSQRFL